MKRGSLVHVLRFTDSVALARAFEEIASHEFVEDCLIDLEALRATPELGEFIRT